MINNKLKILNAILIVVAVFATESCIESYWPELDARYDNALVVDGLITDNIGPYIVKLSLASTVEDPEFIPLTGSVVVISDNTGVEELLTETKPGIYQTSYEGIRGIPGRSYKIAISTPKGKRFESDYQKLSVSTEIDKIYGVEEYRDNLDGIYPTAGMQFYLDTYMAEQDTNFYLWRLENTFQYNANHFIRYIFDGQFHPFIPIDSLNTCWNTSSAKQIITYSTVNLNNPIIKGLPLNYVNTNTKKLSVRYSLLVKQLSITQDAYSFWRSLEELDGESGLLFTKQPFQVRGNVKNVEDEDEPVLGYFTVAGISEKRIYVNRPKDLDFYYGDECNLITEDLITMLYLLRDYWPLKLPGKITEHGFTPAVAINEECLDCTKEYENGSITKPDFWED